VIADKKRASWHLREALAANDTVVVEATRERGEEEPAEAIRKLH
jgi:hypothetical protein